MRKVHRVPGDGGRPGAKRLRGKCETRDFPLRINPPRGRTSRTFPEGGHAGRVVNATFVHAAARPRAARRIAQRAGGTRARPLRMAAFHLLPIVSLSLFLAVLGKLGDTGGKRGEEIRFPRKCRLIVTTGRDTATRARRNYQKCAQLAATFLLMRTTTNDDDDDNNIAGRRTLIAE